MTHDPWQPELDALRAAGLDRGLRRVDSIQAPQIELDGRRVLQFASNNYLDLASHPRLIAAAQEAAHYFGTSASASALVCGHMGVHADLEAAISRFKGSEAALVAGSGYLANQAILTTLVGAGDAIFSDALNHASIVDGCRLSRASVHVYPHRDLAALEQLLRHVQCRRRLIVTDGVFSMDGDIAPLDQICTLAERYDAHVVVDDAHGTGVLGETGRGTLSHFGIDGGRAITMGTLGKALGSYGAFIAGPRAAIDLLVNRGRSVIYSTALPPGWEFSSTMMTSGRGRRAGRDPDGGEGCRAGPSAARADRLSACRPGAPRHPRAARRYTDRSNRGRYGHRRDGAERGLAR